MEVVEAVEDGDRRDEETRFVEVSLRAAAGKASVCRRRGSRVNWCCM